ncbi:MAG: FHA domain-containing protein, partial [Oscillospiraceae bacterium]|nr:FHA domain-containing protein [Oscillospiraceae bacterium]
MEAISHFLLNISKWLLPLLSLWLLLRCVRSMLQQKYKPEIWAYLENHEVKIFPIYHWECLIGRSRSCDIVLSSPATARTHASLIRSGNGKWKLYDLDSKVGSLADGEEDYGKGIYVHDG